MRLRDMTFYDWLEFLVSPRGRIGRFDYNVKFLLILFVLNIVANLIDQTVWTPDGPNAKSPAYITALLNLLALWPFFAVTIKRLHDLNWRGWWMLFFLMLPVWPLLISVFGFSVSGDDIVNRAKILTIAIMLKIVFSIISLAFWIILSCIKGTRGPNRFGDDPLQQQPIEQALSMSPPTAYNF